MGYNVVVLVELGAAPGSDCKPNLPTSSLTDILYMDTHQHTWFVADDDELHVIKTIHFVCAEMLCAVYRLGARNADSQSSEAGAHMSTSNRCTSSVRTESVSKSVFSSQSHHSQPSILRASAKLPTTSVFCKARNYPKVAFQLLAALTACLEPILVQ